MNIRDDTYSDLRSLPSVSRILEEHPPDGNPRELVVERVRRVLDNARRSISAGETVAGKDLLDSIDRDIRRATAPWPVRVINATGVVLHTNLGRAPLSQEAIHAMEQAAIYSDLEMDLETGERGHRDAHVAELVRELTDAEASTVVNNNAGALVLALSALAKGGEVIVSRGQAVEIGGRFRIPDVLLQSGATLREVGTTNRTYPSDYEDACGEETTMLLRVHHSNFYLSGFVADVEVSDLVSIARKRSLIVLNDLGSGCLIDTSDLGLPHEPTVRESVLAGADVTVFSGDKLLGGPQAGLIVGRAEAIQRLRRHPLARALRCDKVTLAALHATLLHYLEGEALAKIPTLRMLSMTQTRIEAKAREWQSRLDLPGTEVARTTARVGGGSLPRAELPGASLVLDPTALATTSQGLAHRLRGLPRPIIARTEKDRIYLDPRTVQEDEIEDLLRGIQVAVQQ